MAEAVPTPLPRWLERLALGCVLVVAGLFNLYRLDTLGINGLGNPYYAAATQSMLTSGRNAFYLAVDPAGFLALDKPPLAPWIQAASARLFGLHGLSLLLPQALAGIACVYVLYRLVARAYGVWPGLLAALTLAVTPIVVVTNRSQHAEAWVTLTMLLAAWAMLKAIEEGSVQLLHLCAVLVGLAFNMKMLQILLVAPVLAALYWQTYPLPRRLRWREGLRALALFAAVALPWMLLVDLTPAYLRPWVGGTQNNRVLELVLGYNGLARLWGEDWRALIGVPGPQRFFTPQLAGQISWLFPLGLVGGAVANRLLLPADDLAPTPTDLRRRRTFILLAAWVAWQLLYFSISTFFHRYYLTLLAPGLAGLIGVGAQALWRYRRLNTFLLVLLLTALLQITIMMPHGRQFLWIALLVPNLSWVCFMAAKSTLFGERGERLLYAAMLLPLLIGPAMWAWIPVSTGTDMTMPYAGPQEQPYRGAAPRPFIDPELVAMLEADREDARYLAASYDMGVVALGMLATGEPWMAVGGYRGVDPILSAAQFSQLVGEGQVRYWLDLQGGEVLPQQAAIRAWVAEHCPEVQATFSGVAARGPCACEP